MDFTKIIVKGQTSKHWESEEETTENSKYNTHSKNVMKVSNYIVSIMKYNVNSRVREKNTSQSTNSEKKNKPFGSEERNRELRSLGPVNSSKSSENLNTSRDSNSHGSSSEVGTSIYIHTNCEHMVSPNNKTKKTDGSHSVNHTIITKDLFLKGVTVNNMRNNTKAWKNKNINLRRTEKSK